LNNGVPGLIVALDTGELSDAVRLAKQLSGRVAAFKIGLSLFAVDGPNAIRTIGEHGRVFCDLKFHDIPHQVGLAARQLARLGVWMFTVHASGGAKMIRAAVDGAASSGPAPLVAAVTVLTSLSGNDLQGIGQGSEVEVQVLRLARLAVGAGATALVCSPHEATQVRSAVGVSPALVLPGIRPAGAAADDQARAASPRDAAEAGADYIVVGRPITEAKSPSEAAEAILEQL